MTIQRISALNGRNWLLVASALLGIVAGCGDDDDDASGVLSRGGSSATNSGGANTGAGRGGATSGGTSSASGTSSSAGANAEGGMPPSDAQGGSGGTAAGAGGAAGAAGDDAGGADGQGEPRVVSLSEHGHSRFFGVTYDGEGSIYAVGQLTSSTESVADVETVIAKFTAEGELDQSFGDGGVVARNVASGTNGELFRGIVAQSDGKIVISGTIEHEGATDARDRDVAVLRFNPDGTLDDEFGDEGVAVLDLSEGVANDTSFLADSAWGLARDDADRLIVSGGKVREGGLDTDFVLVRLEADGALDESFADGGIFALDLEVDGASNNASPRNVTILPNDDGIIGAGYQPLGEGVTAPVLYKVTNDGVLDTTFGDGGVFSESVLAQQTECYAAAVQPSADGGYKLVTTGYGRELEAETSDWVSLRVTSDGELDHSYGDDGLVRLDIGGFADNSRKLAVLPDGRLLLVGGGRLTSADVDGVVAVLTPDGAPDESFSSTGFRAYDLGGPADFFWAVALNEDGSEAAIAGLRGVGSSPNPPSAHDDAAIFLMRTAP